MGFANVVDSDIFVIRKEVLDKIKCVDFKDTNSELKYTTLLVRNGFIPKFCPLIKTYTSIDNFKDRKPSVSFKLSLVWNCLPLIIKSTPKFGEFLLNILTPNFWFLTLVYAGLLSFTNTYELKSFPVINFNLIFTFFVILVISFLVSLYTSKLGRQNIIYLLLYPLYSLLKLCMHIPVIAAVTDKMTKKEMTKTKKCQL